LKKFQRDHRIIPRKKRENFGPPADVHGCV
jgi:hypothetical protein